MSKSFLKILVISATLFMFSFAFAVEIHCNPDTKTCHKSTCRYYNCKGCTKVFQSEEEVTKNGYKFCKVCSEEKSEKNTKKGKK